MIFLLDVNREAGSGSTAVVLRKEKVLLRKAQPERQVTLQIKEIQ